MIIRLPRKFYYTEKKNSSYAYVQNGILYIKGWVNYEDLMYELAYTLKGYDKCYYCGRELSNKNRTIDHMYPRRWGGISITNNMLPSCRLCNGEKRDMTVRQFELWNQKETKAEQEKFYQECIEKNTKIAKKGKFVLKKSWITMYDVSILIHDISFKNLEPVKSDKLSRYYINWHQYPHPIIISSNDWLFKGRHVLYHAKINRIKKVPAIILENVIVLKNST